MKKLPKVKRDKNYFEFDIGSFGIFFNKRYQLLAIINDLTLGIWFTIGSVLFLFSQTQTAGTIFIYPRQCPAAWQTDFKTAACLFY